MAFKQLFIRKDERRLDNLLSAFICVHLRLKNKRNDLYHPQLSAPICGLNPFHSANLRFIESAKSHLPQTANAVLVTLLQKELSWSHFKEFTLHGEKQYT